MRAVIAGGRLADCPRQPNGPLWEGNVMSGKRPRAMRKLRWLPIPVVGFFVAAAVVHGAPGDYPTTTTTVTTPAETVTTVIITSPDGGTKTVTVGTPAPAPTPAKTKLKKLTVGDVRARALSRLRATYGDLRFSMHCNLSANKLKATCHAHFKRQNGKRITRTVPIIRRLPRDQIRVSH